MQIDGQRIHRDDFVNLTTDQVGHGLSQQLVIRNPRAIANQSDRARPAISIFPVLRRDNRQRDAASTPENFPQSKHLPRRCATGDEIGLSISRSGSTWSSFLAASRVMVGELVFSFQFSVFSFQFSVFGVQISDSRHLLNSPARLLVSRELHHL